MRYAFLYFLLTNLLITSAQATSWAETEIENLKQFSFKNIPPLSADSSNKYLFDSNAIKLGKSLFKEQRLSSNSKVSCSSCHIKEKAFTDNKVVATGLRSGLRNVPSLLNAAEHNWFFWDGRKDSLWAQSLSSIENPAEHNFSRVEMLHFIVNDQTYREIYQQIFNHSLPDREELNSYPTKAGPHAKLDDLIAWKKLSKNQKQKVNLVFTNIGKSIAAYVSTIKNTPSRFDRFIEELSRKKQSNILSSSEQKGLKLFTSKKAGCANCHRGSLLTNEEFHNIGTGIRGVDNGRSEVIDTVLRDEFNCLGEYSDATPEQCQELKYTNRDKHVLTGAYKTPSLRNLSKTAPYMHDGRFNTLKEVLTYYSSINDKKAKELDLPAIYLSEEEQAHLVSFLLTL